MSHSVSLPQPAGGDSAISPDIEWLILDTFSSRPPAPLLRPTAPHNLVASPFTVCFLPTLLTLHILGTETRPPLVASGRRVIGRSGVVGASPFFFLRKNQIEREKCFHTNSKISGAHLHAENALCAGLACGRS